MPTLTIKVMWPITEFRLESQQQVTLGVTNNLPLKKTSLTIDAHGDRFNSDSVLKGNYLAYYEGCF